MNQFSAPWLRRAAALALLAGAIVGFYGLVVAPLAAAYIGADQAVAQADELLVRYRNIAARRGALQRRFETLSKKQANSGVYLRGDTDALAAAKLQEIVNSTVEANSGSLRSTRILPPKEDGDFRRVGVRVQMTGNIVAIARILYSFEGGQGFLFVDSLDISNRKARRRKNQADADPELLIRLDLSGYVRPEVLG